MMENETNPWIISIDSFSAEKQQVAEAMLTCGNGYLIQSGIPEEFSSCSPASLSTIFQICTNANCEDEKIILHGLPDWTSTTLHLNAEKVDLKECKILAHKRSLDIRHGVLERSFEIITPSGYHIEAIVQRVLSMDDPEVAAIRYYVKSINFEGKVSFTPIVDDQNGKREQESKTEWNILQTRTQNDVAHIWIQNKVTSIQVCEAMSFDFFKNNAIRKTNPTKIEKLKTAGFSFGADIKNNEYVCVHKFVSILSSQNYIYKELTTKAREKVLAAKEKGWSTLMEESKFAWNRRWESVLPTRENNGELKQQKIMNIYKQIFR